MNISETLASWYQLNKRELPWRSTTDPYLIWLSEVILQQTRVNQGMDYYFRFVDRFPDVYSLAEATEEEVLKLWQGLGFYSRARNMHSAARSIVRESGGVFPSDYLGLLKIKGVGEYTAAAIASISFNEAVPVVDGNVARVLSRLYALEVAVDTSAGLKMLRQLAKELIPLSDPATFNQAIMEFGALQCKPLNADCETCPLRLECRACEKMKVQEYPKKQNRTKVKELYYYYLVITFPVKGKDHVLLHRREKNGIWKNMYDFPLIDSEAVLEIPQALGSGLAASLLGKEDPGRLYVSSEYIHLLSHRKITARFIRFRLEDEPINKGAFISIPVTEIIQYPIPRLIELYLEKEGLI